jgi:hypothetical protein
MKGVSVIGIGQMVKLLVVFFARFDLVILAIRNSLGSCGS